jgi:hypothetical protein
LEAGHARERSSRHHGQLEQSGPNGFFEKSIMTLAEPTADSCNKIRQIRTSRPTQLMIGSTIIRNELALLIRSASPRILRLALALVRSTNPHFSAIDWIWADRMRQRRGAGPT